STSSQSTPRILLRHPQVSQTGAQDFWTIEYVAAEKRAKSLPCTLYGSNAIITDWRIFLDAAWKRFDSKMGPFIQSLEARRAFLESVKASATLFDIQLALDEIRRVRDDQVRTHKREEIEQRDRQKELIKKRLRPHDCWHDHYQIQEKRATNSGQWIFAHPQYQAWHNGNIPGSSVLYVHGKPGSGKSVLMSTIIKELLESSMTAVVGKPVL
ncbi:hypothetical protein B0T20DRAFT_500136, partial [Sordaria brevicollis]